MVDEAAEPAGPRAAVRVVIDHGGREVTYWVAREGFSRPSIAYFYVHAGTLLTALHTLDAQDSPTEGSLIERVERHARTVAAEPNLEAAVGFFDRNGETGLVQITAVPGR